MVARLHRLVGPLALLSLFCVFLSSLPARADGLNSDDFRPMNSLTTLEMINAVLANPTANARLAQNPLTTESLKDPYMQVQLLDGRAQRFMKYLVMCALDSTQTVDWLADTTTVDPNWLKFKRSPGLGGPPWTGYLGLCPQWGTTDWTNSSLVSPQMKQDCLERVSACILAFNNARGRVVPISARASQTQSTNLPATPMRSRVPTFPFPDGLPNTVDLNSGSALISSFRTCSGQSDCGWNPGYVGSCEAGWPIRLPLPPPQFICRIGAAYSFRVCSDIRGCTASTALANASVTCGYSSSVTFTCPSSNTFAVMVSQ